MSERRIALEMDPAILERLMAQQQLAATEFRCLDGDGRLWLKRVCLRLLSRRLRTG